MIRHQAETEEMDPVLDCKDIHERKEYQTVKTGIKKQIAVNGILIKMEHGVAPERLAAGLVMHNTR